MAFSADSEYKTGGSSENRYGSLAHREFKSLPLRHSPQNAYRNLRRPSRAKTSALHGILRAGSPRSKQEHRHRPREVDHRSRSRCRCKQPHIPFQATLGPSIRPFVQWFLPANRGLSAIKSS